MRPPATRAILLAVLVLGVTTSPAMAAVKTWSSTPADGNWSNTSNWNGGVIPANTDDVVFPAASTIHNTTNDIVGLSLNSITFDGNGYSIAGNSITLAAAGVICSTGNAPQTDDLTLPIVLGANMNINPTTGCQLNIASTISGGFGLTKIGAGSAQISGGNSFTGAVQISTGNVAVDNGAALGSADGTPATGTTVSSGAALNVLAVAVGNERLSLAGFGSLAGGLYGSGTASWGGPIVLTADSAISPNGGTFTISNTISGAFNLTFNLGGTVILSGTGTYTGTTTAQNGVHLRVNGVLSGSSAVTILGSNSIGGIGTVSSPLTTLSASAIDPGQSPGILTTGNLLLSSNTNTQIELNGTTVGSQYDQLNVVGTASIGGANLNIFLSFVPAPGTQFVVLNNDAADPIVGTFAGLSEGSSFSSGGSTFSITYVGGTGNDVVLTVLQSVPTAPYILLLALGGLLTAGAAWRLGPRRARAI